MDITGIGSVLDFGSKLIDRLWPDPAQQNAAKLQLLQMQQAGEFKELDMALEVAKGQLTVDQAEAANGSVFVSGWRPFVGWVCGGGCAWNWIGLPIANFAATALGHPLNVSPADISQMFPLLMGLLGMGGLRTVEKIKGVAAS